ncbi:MAG TPA: methylmalonyl-CoA epimerase [Chitinophagales bacterium]|nr:methylmalonyl-CoA epimerase [Chitinophagales bacterium]HNM31172.1 methylmalonyl-CoA epimerase [Chitinophagales bacterium]
MKKIDHIGIAVKNLEQSNELFSKLFNRPPFHQETLDTQQLAVSFFKLDDTKIELLYPISEKSTVHKYLENKGEGIHHVAFEVEDIFAEIERLKGEGFQPLSEKPYVGALNKLVCFFHPKTTNGVLVELCQKQ